MSEHLTIADVSAPLPDMDIPDNRQANGDKDERAVGRRCNGENRSSVPTEVGAFSGEVVPIRDLPTKLNRRLAVRAWSLRAETHLALSKKTLFLALQDATVRGGARRSRLSQE